MEGSAGYANTHAEPREDNPVFQEYVNGCRKHRRYADRAAGKADIPEEQVREIWDRWDSEGEEATLEEYEKDKMRAAKRILSDVTDVAEIVDRPPHVVAYKLGKEDLKNRTKDCFHLSESSKGDLGPEDRKELLRAYYHEWSTTDKAGDKVGVSSGTIRTYWERAGLDIVTSIDTPSRSRDIDRESLLDETRGYEVHEQVDDRGAMYWLLEESGSASVSDFSHFLSEGLGREINDIEVFERLEEERERLEEDELWFKEHPNGVYEPKSSETGREFLDPEESDLLSDIFNRLTV
ncbi:MAG: hypothetical protein ABEJ62_02500 [Candidatus Nanohaloarchaea archaeon]